MADEQTVAATPQASAPPVESDDSLIGDILKGDAEKPSSDADGGDDAEGEQGEAQADDEHESDDSTDDAEDDSAPAEAAEDDDAAPVAAPDAGALKAARKAADEGDLDKAFKLAFGKKPEEMFPDDKVWTKWRAANNKREHAFRAQEQQVTQREHHAQQWVTQQRQQISGIIDQLRPYEEIHQARVAFKQSGDPELLKAILEKTAEMPYDEVQKIILTKSRRSPGERALAQQVQTLMQKLEEKERKAAEETQQMTQQQQYQADLGIIQGQLKGEVTKVPRFAERVYAVLLKTAAPTGITLTVEEAGRRVLAAERRKLAKHPLLPRTAAPKNPVSAAASTLAKAKKAKGAAPVLRRDSRGNGAVDEKSESTDDILRDILPGKKRATSL
jgi:hypothetical protein